MSQPLSGNRGAEPLPVPDKGSRGPRVFDHIHWHLQIRAKGRGEAEKVIQQFSHKAGVRVRILSCEGAWKVENLFDAKVISPFNCTDPAQAVFRLLLLMKAVASGWQIKGPIDYEDNMWLFGALAAAPLARFSVQGIEWLNVEIRNFPLVQQG